MTAAEIASLKAANPLSEIIPRYATGERVIGGKRFWLCPFHDEKTPSLTLTPDGGAFICFGCGAKGDIFEFIAKVEGSAFSEAVEHLRREAGVVGEGNGGIPPNSGKGANLPISENTPALVKPANLQICPSEPALAIWRAAVSDPEKLRPYLGARGITIAAPPSLRFHPGLAYFDGHAAGGGIVLPAMVAGVQAADRRLVAVHRTYLRPDGTGKASVATPKKMLGPCAGCAVRLAPVAERLLVAEGIETALAAMQATGLPAWAALSTSGLRGLILPDSVRDVVVAADADQPGVQAAEVAAWRWTAEGRTVRIAYPPDGLDFADVLAGDAMETCHA